MHNPDRAELNHSRKVSWKPTHHIHQRRNELQNRCLCGGRLHAGQPGEQAIHEAIKAWREVLWPAGQVVHESVESAGRRESHRLVRVPQAEGEDGVQLCPQLACQVPQPDLNQPEGPGGREQILRLLQHITSSVGRVCVCVLDRTNTHRRRRTRTSKGSSGEAAVCR